MFWGILALNALIQKWSKAKVVLLLKSNGHPWKVIDQSETKIEYCCGINIYIYIYIWGRRIYSRGLNILQRRSGAERRGLASVLGSEPTSNKLGCQQSRDVKQKASTVAPTRSHGKPEALVELVNWRIQITDGNSFSIYYPISRPNPFLSFGS